MIERERLMWAAGWLCGRLVAAGLEVEPIRDSAGNYSGSIRFYEPADYDKPRTIIELKVTAAEMFGWSVSEE